MEKRHGYALKVQADGSHDIFVWGKSAVDQVRVVDNVPAEQNRSSDCVQEVDCAREGDEYPDNPGHACNNTTVCEQGGLGKRSECLQRAMRPPKSHGPKPEKSYCILSRGDGRGVALDIP